MKHVSDTVTHVGKKADARETRLVELHKATERDTLAIGRLLIELRDEHPRGEWTAYLEGLAQRTAISRRTLFRYIAAIEKPKVEKPPTPDFRKTLTPDGHRTDEMVSLLQKAIRRGIEDLAVFAATELDLAGFPGAVWNRLLCIASEDIGIADPMLCVQIRSLFETWKYLKGLGNDEHKPELLPLIDAVLRCVRAKKSRIVDDCLNDVYRNRLHYAELPDWCLDMHTAKGKAMGRGFEHFYKEGAKLANEAPIENPYRETARKAMLRKAS